MRGIWQGLAVLALVISGSSLSSADSNQAAGSAPDASVTAEAADGGLADAGPADEANGKATGNPADPCAPLEARLARRKSWLAARRQEQFELGGTPDPSHGVANATGIWCEAHPDDEECALGSVAISVSPDELVWSPQSTPEDYDPQVILMRRAVAGCREQQARRR